MISPGGSPRLPDCVKPVFDHPNIIHSSSYMADINNILGKLKEQGERPLTIGILNKYAPIVIGLLGANVFVVLILCLLAVYFMVAVRRDRGATSGRALRPDYRPLKLDRKAEEHQDHSSGITDPYDP